ncbi:MULTISPECIES: peptide chain release factor 1 [Limnochorda]|uniref:peptide chain release factor 1 n=1 Tax=Limnochorda TaxID=1676651 RepID=UPI001DD2293D|nr:peptide chain release factor 1 [Limnochorda pilosa]MBO2485797.1 peptide chain release factor 1 [Bacillota bacterium]MBO2519265.1 peptide chain release factor 1 [Bacillota bacterium]
MGERLQELIDRYEELTRQLMDPDLLADGRRYEQVARAQAELRPIVEHIRAGERLDRELADARQLAQEADDPELKALAQEEVERLTKAREAWELELRKLLIPKDPNDERNVLVEIRAGAGGEEAALFAADLLRMYTRYAERQGWRVELMSSTPTELGGFKEVIVQLSGRGAYSQLKFESGVHRVQRVPITESGGRIHTSTATVAVLPEAEEVDVVIDPQDLRIDIFRASGHGGQSVNTTDSAVRITHLPTGLVVTCQDERSQLKNKEKALRVLRARLLDRARREQAAQLAESRRSQVGTGERSERIRTYNFPQGRVTDHRFGLTLYKLEAVLDGELDELIEAARAAEQERLLQEVQV